MKSRLLPLSTSFVVLALALGACGGDDDPAPTAPAEEPPAAEAPAGGGEETDAVTVEDFEFLPPEITVRAGTEITWTNEDSTPHTATSDEEGVFDTASIDAGDEGTAKLDEPGTFSYFCEFHPNMKGTITVE